jgi:hypothetical protein
MPRMQLLEVENKELVQVDSCGMQKPIAMPQEWMQERHQVLQTLDLSAELIHVVALMSSKQIQEQMPQEEQ